LGERKEEEEEEEEEEEDMLMSISQVIFVRGAPFPFGGELFSQTNHLALVLLPRLEHSRLME
jgi:hypothetical protein